MYMQYGYERAGEKNLGAAKARIYALVGLLLLAVLLQVFFEDEVQAFRAMAEEGILVLRQPANDVQGNLDADAVPSAGYGRILFADTPVYPTRGDHEEPLAYLSGGQVVEINTLYQDGYVGITHGLVNGYMKDEQLLLMDGLGRNGTVKKDDTPVWDSTGSSPQTIGSLTAGCGVQVLDFVDGDVLINYDGVKGFVPLDGLILEGTFTEEAEVRYLAEGMAGMAVTALQKDLADKGYLIGGVTGTYGPETTAAIQGYQKAVGAVETGRADRRLLAEIKVDDGSQLVNVQASQVQGRVAKTPWNGVNKAIPVRAEYTVIDVKTGISWRERRFGGVLHLDSEPITTADVAKLKQAYGGNWSWNRRPVWVVYENNIWAASINGVPHMGYNIKDNNFDGHHCIHFYQSQVHASRKEDADHQACVEQAFAVAQ
ncbi:peptidoglycan-binding protein [Eubacteriales bacterium OttesenSCG-928-M02]|nr:peptidoglycan-binding protein [Eubacteriales bacterium OttesenSCG-928-M02]